MKWHDCLEEVTCLICGGVEQKEIYPARYPEVLDTSDMMEVYSSSSDTKLMDRLVRCQSCGFVYLGPRLRGDLIQQFYTEGKDPVFIQQNAMRIITFKRIMQKLIKKYGQRWDNLKGQQVLDVGCAGGAFPAACQELGLQVVGIEPSRWLVEQAQKLYQLDIRQGTLLSHTFPANNFDMITLWDVIEHIADPGPTLSQIYHYLKDDGIFVVNFPDINSWVARLMGRFWPFYLSVHLSYFNRHNISQYLGNYGFEVVEMRPYFQSLPLGYVYQRARQIIPLPKFFEKVLQWCRLSQRQFTYQMGQTLLVARKRGKNAR
jgi:2-polyprenyl-3-methyl-5-hydroxy-6-metoxy-1,4-benzoquinol methylase